MDTMEQPGAAVPPGIDEARLGPYLCAVLDDYDPARKLTITLLTGGRSNLTYRLSQADRNWVLRRPPLGHVMPSAHDMAREFRTLSFLAGNHFPVPEPLALCEDESVLGVAFQILGYVPGVVISDEAATRRLSAADAGHLCRELIRVLTRLHGIPAPAQAPDRSTSCVHYLRRQVNRWTAQWERTKTRELPSFARLSQWLQGAISSVPEDRRVTVVHGDYRLDNLILDPVSKDIRAVLDWEMSTLGDPLMDLALLLVYSEQSGDILRKRVAVARNLTTVPGFWPRGRLAEEYFKGAAIPADKRHLDICLALACLKLAVIMESVHYRYLAGQTVDELSAGLEEAAPALLRMGVLVSEGKGIDGLAA
jgi:aminoglycoside phosphotransferase (APT) family kinase protein